MTEKFDPTQYLQNLEKRPNYPPRYYLPVNARVAWFRAENANGAIITTPETIGDVFYVRAQIIVGGEIRATGIAGVRSGKGTTWDGRELEKSETAAIGRALAHVGYGTLYALQDDDEDALSDAPVQPTKQPAQTKATPAPNISHIDETTRELACAVVELKEYTDKKTKETKLRVVYNCADGVFASSFTRDHARQAGYVVDTWTQAGRYELPVTAIVTVKKNGDFWDVVSVRSSMPDTLAPTGTDTPF